MIGLVLLLGAATLAAFAVGYGVGRVRGERHSSVAPESPAPARTAGATTWTYATTTTGPRERGAGWLTCRARRRNRGATP